MLTFKKVKKNKYKEICNLYKNINSLKEKMAAFLPTPDTNLWIELWLEIRNGEVFKEEFNCLMITVQSTLRRSVNL